MIVCVLLAAGSSSRMKMQYEGMPVGAVPGTVPKMLLPYQNTTLLQHQLSTLQAVPGCSILVVTGCYHSILQPILAAQQIAYVFNSNWQAGMGSSIHTAVQHINEYYPASTGVLLTVCDQPFISSALLINMLALQQSQGKNIVACTYQGTTGTPVFFSKKYFSQLLQLNGTQGAKQVVQQHIADTVLVNFEAGATDIDTAADYQQLTG
jgi:molybdenum cofactor cytidylyltransferase